MKKIYRTQPFLAFSLMFLLISSMLLMLYLSFFQSITMSYIVLGSYGITLALYAIYLYKLVKSKLKNENPSI